MVAKAYPASEAQTRAIGTTPRATTVLLRSSWPKAGVGPGPAEAVQGGVFGPVESVDDGAGRVEGGEDDVGERDDDGQGEGGHHGAAGEAFEAAVHVFSRVMRLIARTTRAISALSTTARAQAAPTSPLVKASR